MENKFVPHDNLSDKINFDIMKSEKDGGIKLEDIKIEQSLIVQTKNTTYTIRKINNKIYVISGHPIFCSKETYCNIAGSTWSGSMIKVGFIGIDMHLEFFINQKRITTSRIESIKIK